MYEFEGNPGYTLAFGSSFTFNLVPGIKWSDTPTDYADQDIYPFGTLEFSV